jgi:uracil-DNA glycosylase
MFVINDEPEFKSIIDYIEYVILHPPPTWDEVFTENSDALREIGNWIHLNCEMKNIEFTPTLTNIFRALYLTRLPEIKAIIVGQDPYHQIGDDGELRATGLCFSVRRNDSIPSSLSNIFKELMTNNVGFQLPSHGDLSDWARQGILMINMSLTCNLHDADSHRSLWLSFIIPLLRKVVNSFPRERQPIFLLWGRKAQEITSYLNGGGIILTAAHPSGLSARRGFFGCEHFSKLNQLLIQRGDRQIDFNLS